MGDESNFLDMRAETNTLVSITAYTLPTIPHFTDQFIYIF